MQTVRRSQQSFRTITTFVLAAAVVALASIATPAAAQTFTVVSDFTNLVQGPSYLQYMGAIPQGRDGNLYGTSHEGGTSNIGTFFSVSPSGTETTAYSFDGTKGSYPSHGVMLASDGNFYGTTYIGGTSNLGTLYKMTSAGAITVLYNYASNGNGSSNGAPPTQGTDGNFYGTTNGDFGAFIPHVYKMTPAGVLTTIHTMTVADGYNGCALIQATDGSFYGISQSGGANNHGTVFKVSTTGAYKVLHNFTGTDGSGGFAPLVQATDGNFYGMTPAGGATNGGVIFKMTASGALTVLHSLSSATDGTAPQAGLVQATDGNLYGTTFSGGTLSGGAIFKVTTAGAFTVVHSFDGTNGTNGDNPGSTLTQHTNGLLYGDTYLSKGGGVGLLYSLNIGAAPFIRLSVTSGKAGSQVGIFGQSFSTSSVVKFNGVAATAAVLTGTTYITATVPAGASTGLVTVTTGSTTLTSLQKFLVHDAWSAGTPIPTPVAFATAAAVQTSIYVVGGTDVSGATNKLQIYNPITNAWSTGTVYPTPIASASSAVVGNVLYVFGGSADGTNPTNAVWAYSPSTKKWTAKAAMPTARWSTGAVVDKNIVYVMGGSVNASGNGEIATVESYNPATNSWATEAPMAVAKGAPAAGLLGTTIVVADGGTNGQGNTGDNESYNVTTNKWTTITADPTARYASCYGVIGTQLYDMGGTNTANSSFTLAGNKWTTTLAPVPKTGLFPGSAVYGGQLYCMGGWATFGGTITNNVQIYQP